MHLLIPNPIKLADVLIPWVCVIVFLFTSTTFDRFIFLFSLVTCHDVSGGTLRRLPFLVPFISFYLTTILVIRK